MTKIIKIRMKKFLQLIKQEEMLGRLQIKLGKTKAEIQKLISEL